MTCTGSPPRPDRPRQNQTDERAERKGEPPCERRVLAEAGRPRRIGNPRAERLTERELPLSA